MPSEGTETLILAFTLKTGQSVAQNRCTTFLFGLFYQRIDIYRNLISLISDYKVQGYGRDRTKQIGNFAFFIDFSSTQPAQVLGNADLRYHLSRLNQYTAHLLQDDNAISVY